MRRCPECRRDYYDETLLYCLDDGNALLDGPKSEPGARADSLPGGGEPATAILHTTDAVGDSPTRAQIHTTEQTAVLPPGIRAQARNSFDKRLLAAPVLAVLIAAGAYFGYRSFQQGPAQIESIAVLPFENRSGNSDTDYLSDGLAESLVYRFSQLSSLKVSPTNAVRRYKGKDTDVPTIAKELEVDAVMTGSLTQRGDDLTISVELTDARTKKLIWAEQYSRKMSDLLTTQNDIASAVTQKLELKLSGDDTKGLTKSYTNDNEAYQLYLKGRFFWNKRTPEGLKAAIEQFKAASDKDPNFALAYVGLADSYLVGLYNARGRDKEDIPMAKAYATQAFEIDPSLAEVNASLGLVNHYLWNWADAEKYYERAIELNPNYPSARHWYSRLLRAQGKFDEAFEQIILAQRADSLSVAINNNVSESLLQKGDIEGAIAESRRGQEIGSSWVQYRTMAHCYLSSGQKDEALANARKAAEILNDSPVTLKVLGYVQAAIGNRNEALAIAKELEDKFAKREADGRDVAVVYAGLGENDKVFGWLEKDFQKHASSLTELRLEHPFVSLRSDPRFKDLVKRMGLPE